MIHCIFFGKWHYVFLEVQTITGGHITPNVVWLLEFTTFIRPTIKGCEVLSFNIMHGYISSTVDHRVQTGLNLLACTSLADPSLVHRNYDNTEIWAHTISLRPLGQKKKMLCLWLHGPKKKGRSVGFFFFFFFLLPDILISSGNI